MPSSAVICTANDTPRCDAFVASPACIDMMTVTHPPSFPVVVLSLLSIVRAFLIEEQKIVKAVLKQRGGGKKAAAATEK
jgi:hypothetical protein